MGRSNCEIVWEFFCTETKGGHESDRPSYSSTYIVPSEEAWKLVCREQQTGIFEDAAQFCWPFLHQPFLGECNSESSVHRWKQFCFRPPSGQGGGRVVPHVQCWCAARWWDLPCILPGSGRWLAVAGAIRKLAEVFHERREAQRGTRRGTATAAGLPWHLPHVPGRATRLALWANWV